MRRSASEIINNLESRVARLERNASPTALADFIDFCMKYDLKEEGDLAEVSQKVFLNLIARNKFGSKGLKLRNGQVMLTSFGEQVLNENMRVARLEGSRTASSDVRRAGKKVIEAIDKLQEELEKMPSFNSDESYYEDLRERFEALHLSVHKEVQFITGAY